jgi:peptidoglycan/xylan/chitin deacetylase (PgdA/CDA1 family)
MMATRSVLWIAALSTTVIPACGMDASEDSQSLEAAAAPYAEIDFATRPSYLSNKTVSLSFDDGPDWNNTAKVLDILKQKNVKATFFINTKNWSDVDSEEPMRALVRRMVNEGHGLGNHTVHHPHLGSLSSSQIEAEVAGVERTVRSVVGSSAPRVTLFRAPFGEPYQGNDPAHPNAAYRKVAPVVARHAVEIGWAIDPADFDCGDGNCVYNHVVSLLKTPGKGSYGIVLLHSVQPQTVAALPRIIDYVKSKGFKLASVESVVKKRFGKSSAQIVDEARRALDAGELPQLDLAPVYDEREDLADEEDELAVDGDEAAISSVLDDAALDR